MTERIYFSILQDSHLLEIRKQAWNVQSTQCYNLKFNIKMNCSIGQNRVEF